MREPLPARRRTVTRKVTFQGSAYFVSVGFYDDGRPGEVFADGAKEGSGMLAIMRDACIAISIGMQYGVPPAEIGGSLGKVPAFTDGNETETHASIIGLIVSTVLAEIMDTSDA